MSLIGDPLFLLGLPNVTSVYPYIDSNNNSKSRIHTEFWELTESLHIALTALKYPLLKPSKIYDGLVQTIFVLESVEKGRKSKKKIVFFLNS